MSCKTTHHHACDCREAYFKSLEAGNKKLTEALRKIVKYAGHVQRCEPNLNYRGGCDAARIAEQALSEEGEKE